MDSQILKRVKFGSPILMAISKLPKHSLGANSLAIKITPKISKCKYYNTTILQGKWGPVNL
jgi:hypothetical protein